MGSSFDPKSRSTLSDAGKKFSESRLVLRIELRFAVRPRFLRFELSQQPCPILKFPAE